MKLLKKSSVIFMLCLMTLSGTAIADDADGLFIELSSGDLFKVRRALQVGTMVKTMRKVPVTINISLGATRYVDSNFPIAKMAKLRGESVHDLMNKFLKAGGDIYVCPMCLAGNGIDEKDMINGIEMGSPQKTLPLIMDDDVKLLSY